jgi:NAD dependent epimerase/dehydratase family enzyme
MKLPRKIILAGGSGFLGRTLDRWFTERGWQVVVLSRHPASVVDGRTIYWDGETLGPWAKELEGAAAVVNLAGRSVNCRYDARNRTLMMDSRLRSTRVLGEAIRKAEAPPAVWLNSSTATIYRHTCGTPHDEEGEIGAWLLRTETELILKSRRVVPRRLLDEGFAFRYPTLAEGIDALVH